MSDLKPDVREMLEIGKGCGLEHIAEAYQNYMNHSDCFFLFEKYAEQSRDFAEEMERIGLITKTDGDPPYQMCDLSIEAAIEKVDEYEIRRKASGTGEAG